MSDFLQNDTADTQGHKVGPLDGPKVVDHRERCPRRQCQNRIGEIPAGCPCCIHDPASR